MENNSSENFNNMLKNLLNHSIDILCIFDLEGKFIYTNPSFTRVLGYSKKDIINRSYMDIIHRDDIKSMLKAYDDLKNEQEVIFLKNRFKVKDTNKYCWLSWTFINKDDFIYSVARDITKDVEIAEKLDIAEQMLIDGIEDLKTLKSNHSYAAEKLDKVIHNLHEISGTF